MRIGIKSIDKNVVVRPKVIFIQAIKGDKNNEAH
jgi:hypothetical protein